MSNEGDDRGMKAGCRHRRTNSSISRNKTFAVLFYKCLLSEKKEKANAKKVSTTKNQGSKANVESQEKR